MGKYLADFCRKRLARLEEHGFTREQAEGIAGELSEVVSEAQLERALHRQTRYLFTTIVTVAAFQTALTVTLIELLS